MTLVADITPHIVTEAPGVPETLARSTLVETTRRFCRKTRYWRVNLDSFLTVAGTFRYDLFPPVNNSSISDIISIRVNTNSTFLARVTYSKLQFNLDNSGNPTQFALETAGQVILAPVPSNNTDLVYVRAALVPDVGSTSIDDRVYEDYGETLIHGTLHRLLRMPGKPWTSGPMSSFYGDLYSEKEQEATAIADDEYTVGVKRVVAYGGY